jgi:hypothetical protein
MQNISSHIWKLCALQIQVTNSSGLILFRQKEIIGTNLFHRMDSKQMEPF